MKKLFSLSIIALLFAMNTNTFAQNVNVTPNPATYATLQAAFAGINGGLHGAGAVTVTIVNSTVEAASASLLGGVFASCLIIPQGAITVQGNFNASVIDLNGADNVVIDGLNASGNSLTIVNPNAGTGANGVQCSNGATNNQIRNITCVGLGAIGGTNGGRGVNIGQSIAGTGGNNDNLIENVTTNGFRRGIQNFGTATLFINERTTIRGCKIKNFTSLGIFIGSEVSDNLVENNEVFYDASVQNDVGAGGTRGINIQGCGMNIVRKNWIHDMSGTLTGGFFGVIAIPVAFTAPLLSPRTTVEVSNNMVAMNNCISTAGFIYGIYFGHPTGGAPFTAKAYYNSIRIAGATDVATAADAYCLSSFLDASVGQDSIKFYNNVSKNDRSGGTTASLFLAQVIIDPASSLEADHNVAFTTDTTVRGWDAAYTTSLYRGLVGMELYKDTL